MGDATRPEARRFFATLIIGVAGALCLGHTLRMPTMLGANDISRWCMVWGLVERGTYAIDDCPWQSQTQDKVYKEDWRNPEAKHFYSSKPTLLPTLIAGMVYPFRAAVGVPLESVVEQPRTPRLDRPDEIPKPMEWPAHVFYLKPVLVVLNVIPFMIMLGLYARLLDRYAANDWAWMASLTAAAFGTQLIIFNTTLNNHTVGAYSAFFAAYLFLKVWDNEGWSPWTFLGLGFWTAFAACNEMPAAIFAVLLTFALLYRFPRQTLKWFAPAAAIPCGAFLLTQYLSFGSVVPVYAEFGTQTYKGYEGSYWNLPLEMDAMDEPKPNYLFHMTLGHHGILSLTPIFILSFVVLFRMLFGYEKRMRTLGVIILAVSASTIAFYTIKTNNYGGTTQGLRWLMWLFPLWLIALFPAMEPGQTRTGYRRLTLVILLLSVFSIGYGLRGAWGHPWVLDMIDHLDIYPIKR